MGRWAPSLSQSVHLNNNPNKPNPRPSNPLHGTMDMFLVSANELYCSYAGLSRLLFVAVLSEFDVPRCAGQQQLAQPTGIRNGKPRSSNDFRLSFTLRQVENRVQHTVNIPALLMQDMLSNAYQHQRVPLLAVDPSRNSRLILIQRPRLSDL